MSKTIQFARKVNEYNILFYLSVIFTSKLHFRLK